MKKNETTNPQLCTYKYDNETTCNRPLTRGYKDKEGEQYCIFHARNDEKLEELKKQMGIEFSNASESLRRDIHNLSLSEDNENQKDKIAELRSKYALNYEGAYLPDGFDYYQQLTLPVDISFNKCVFNGRSDFSNVTFKGLSSFKKTAFCGYADIKHTIFNGKADFYKATFNGEADFIGVTFIGKADFHIATFSGMAHFYKVIFSGDADFEDTTFHREAYFTDTAFSGEADFEDATLSGKADFYKATFSEKVKFLKATFSGKADFYKATFSGKADFYKAIFRGETDFNEVRFKCEANFSAVTFIGEADFEDAVFNGGASFRKTTFSEEANFRRVFFSQKTVFEYANFIKKSYFRETAFLGENEFTDVFFIADVSFNSCRIDKGKLKFLDTAFFSTSSFRDISEGTNITFINCCLSGVTFLRSRISDTLFSNCYFNLTLIWFDKNIIKWIEHERWYLLKKQYNKIKALNKKRKKLKEKNLLSDHREFLEQHRFLLLINKYRIWVYKFVIYQFRYLFHPKFDSLVKDINFMDGSSNLIDFGAVKDCYMQLKVNMDRMKDYDLANDFYYGEMEMKRLGEKWYKPKRWFLALYKTLSGYGNAPVRAAIMFFALIWIFSFPLFFMKLGIKDLSSQNKNQVSQRIVRLETSFFRNFGEMASLSLYNMTALSNLTRSPYEPLSKWTSYYVSVVQYFIRPVQIALIILAIRRKVKRGEE